MASKINTGLLIAGGAYLLGLVCGFGISEDKWKKELIGNGTYIYVVNPKTGETKLIPKNFNVETSKP